MPKTVISHIEGAVPATEDLPERSARFSGRSYSDRWITIGADGDVCGNQPTRKTDTTRTGWDHEAMRE